MKKSLSNAGGYSFEKILQKNFDIPKFTLAHRRNIGKNVDFMKKVSKKFIISGFWYIAPK